MQDLNGTPLHSLVWMRKPGTSWEAAATASDPITVPRPSRTRVTALQLAQKLLEKGADPNARIAWKEMPMTKGLGTTKNPPNINLGRHYLSFVGSTPFYNAARNGDARHDAACWWSTARIRRCHTAVGVTPLMAAACLDYYEGETPGPLTGVPEAERLEAVKLALELGNDINAKVHLGDYPMIGTSESMLAHYPDNLRRSGGSRRRRPALGWLHCSARRRALQPAFDPPVPGRSAARSWMPQSRLGWTPLTLTKGIFMANSKKEFPVAAQILKKAMAQKGLLASNE